MKTCSTWSKRFDQYLINIYVTIIIQTINETLKFCHFLACFLPQSESDRSQNEDVDVWKEDEEDDDIFSDTGLMDVVSALCLNLSFTFQYGCKMN